MSKRIWTAARVADLRRLAADGKQIPEIAAALSKQYGRAFTPRAVEHAAGRNAIRIEHDRAKSWSHAELKLLRELAADGIKSGEIARAVCALSGRVVSAAQVRTIASERNIPLRNTGGRSASAAPDADATKELNRERQTRERLQAAMQAMIQTHDVPVAQYHRTSGRFGVVSDTHYGSLWERPDLVQKAYRIMRREGIRSVYHAGDFCEGSGMRRGHEHELAVVGADAQVRHALNVHPHFKGMTTYFILGRHDLSFHKNAGHNIAAALAARDDLVSLGGEQVGHQVVGTTSAWVPLKIGKTTINMLLEHPGKGTAYALSYQVQKMIEALPGGRKPEILVVGHYHKAEFLPNYRNVAAFQAGCLESQTDWMREHNIAAHVGFWMTEVRATRQGLARIKGEFTPFFEL